ncbi:putative necrosis and ethylene inducing peptide 1 precursor [Macrophomina phaseolina]|uniref:Necrosis and ethylene inducing peptide 1 n=1 Tax=Macrophomina phaseolina TaxID=35725 RepID=A0ABQ8GBC8_9PEZI|nr:putative necrosis and ethylene inducing peptide 1 precursor [Macrophomina phaseolina]
MTERVRGGVEGNAIHRYEPFLHIAHGCQSYTATYARGGWYKGRYAIMYSWFMPKDQIVDGGGNAGHRHDWENVVIVIDNPANGNPRVWGAGASGHGGYKAYPAPQMRDGNRLQVEYFTNFPQSHQVQFKTSPGRDIWMADWADLPAPARDALQSANFGKANVPFKNGN